MKTTISFTPKFVEHIPDQLEERTLYISMAYATATHLCACGCHNEVVTPFSPTDWQLFFDGDAIFLKPSIGNWDFPCRSHYWIQGNNITWARQWSNREIEQGKAKDRLAKNAHNQERDAGQKRGASERKGAWARLTARFRPRR